MGGGAGVSLHGRFRVATDNTVYARNQTQVTFFSNCYFFISIQDGLRKHKKFACHDAA